MYLTSTGPLLLSVSGSEMSERSPKGKIDTMGD
jgi:hypothetical protein